LASGPNQEKSKTDDGSFKLKLSDKIWIAAVIAVFVITFILIVVYDIF
jgi:hypothetical protein